MSLRGRELGVPRTHYLNQLPPHPSDRPAVGMVHEDLEAMNDRYGDSYWTEMHGTRARRARQDGV